ncbi:DNA-binding protein SNT1 [Purpureocillium lavendulum]|uniref:DNA-binding protein SNT1 n=1 Tax=Purpureocillium lavendulum TaxID=1247861 RepID=A0AB34FM01_9HYPO|nr:DNA-binding protein SNT1 [Purpureocillium lavendulum]
MFATEHCMDAMMDAGRKRLRDDDDVTVNAIGFSEHRNKRLQALPLRTSPKSSHQWRPSSSVTPLNANASEGVPQLHFAPRSPSPTVELQVQDVDMEMADDGPQASDQLQDSRTALDPSDRNNVNRMPTPIQPSFIAQVRGQQSEWTASGSAMNGVVNMGHHQTGFSECQSVPRAMAAEADWASLPLNRRLPSPISEGGDSAQSQSIPSMTVDDEDASGTIITPAHTRTAPLHAMDHPNAMDMEPCHGDTDAASPSPGRRGHVRSKHTINSWTWQPGMKKSFSIGYRSDCEKCRLKVPGHFNHIVIS